MKNKLVPLLVVMVVWLLCGVMVHNELAATSVKRITDITPAQTTFTAVLADSTGEAAATDRTLITTKAPFSSYDMIFGSWIFSSYTGNTQADTGNFGAFDTAWVTVQTVTSWDIDTLFRDSCLPPCTMEFKYWNDLMFTVDTTGSGIYLGGKYAGDPYNRGALLNDQLFFTYRYADSALSGFIANDTAWATMDYWFRLIEFKE